VATVTLENHVHEPGKEFIIPGLGLVNNFETKELDEAQVFNYEANGLKFPADGNLVIVQMDPADVEEVVIDLVESDDVKEDVV
jgi:hypothetical protein